VLRRCFHKTRKHLDRLLKRLGKFPLLLVAPRRFQPAQFVRQADLKVQKPVVDGTQLDGQRGAGKLRGNCREAGHAQDHCRNLSDSSNLSDFTLGTFIRRMYALSATGASARSPLGMRIASEFRG